MSDVNEMPISQELLDILRCPLAVQEKEKYGSNLNKEKLESFGRIVFHNDEVEIIETELNFYD